MIISDHVVGTPLIHTAAFIDSVPKCFTWEKLNSSSPFFERLNPYYFSYYYCCHQIPSQPPLAALLL